MGYFVIILFVAYSFYGKVSEWFKEPVLKTGDPARDRGFESHPLRQEAYLEKYSSGWRGRFAKPLVFDKGSMGSNPIFSAIFIGV